MKKQVEYLQKIFYDLWNDFGKVYLMVRYSGSSVIGKRGFTEEERKQGLVLVFNNKTNNKMEWDAEGNVSCVLAFGTQREDVYLHHDDLLGVFSPEAGVQFMRSDIGKETAETPSEQTAEGGDGKVVSLSSFKKRQK
jgi:hypothetical protein